jgi:hypothetical protein
MTSGLVDYWTSHSWMTCELVNFVISCASLLMNLLVWRHSIWIAVYKGAIRPGALKKL